MHGTYTLISDKYYKNQEKRMLICTISLQNNP